MSNDTKFWISVPFQRRQCGIVVAIGITTVVGIYLLLSRRCWFAALVLTVAGGAILNRLLRSAFQRARPQLDDPIFTFTGYSFPSGHTLTATVVYGFLAALIVANTKNQIVRVVVIVFGKSFDWAGGVQPNISARIT